MSLHPIVALNHVIDEYRDYLLTEFRAKDRALKESLERALDEPQFLAQEPFFQAHRPFKSGKKWSELPIDPRLAHVMESRSRQEHAYLHQSDAIDRLLGANAGPVVVTTGTGSGKTEAFLLPVIQNAIEDAARFHRAGLTAILLYPMNALANDQSERICEYLGASGFDQSVRVAQYDRSTSQTEREAMRRNPPHILLTNYMMLEYLLVRPADRDGIFANHRCRFLVLDEVHSYRGTLGSNIAFLVRRLRMHLARARHDWNPDPIESDRAKRFPSLIPVATSATIKSLSELGLSREDRIRLRDEAVKEFFGKLTGVELANSITVIGEELEQIHVPKQAVYPGQPVDMQIPNLDDENAVREALCILAGQPTDLPVHEAARRCKLLWDLNGWLIAAPMSTSQIVQRVIAEIPERRDGDLASVRHEVETTLMLGAALPDGVPGALRLRVHRFIRGGWRFYRCVDPACGRVYPMGEERCECGSFTAPLYLCRNCGADYLRFVGTPQQTLRPSALPSDDGEWMLYEPQRFEQQFQVDEDADDQEQPAPPGAFRAPAQMRGRPVLRGSFDPSTFAFSSNPTDYRMQVALAPARTRCICCGGSAGSRNVITPVALGTSAAIKVLAEGLVEALHEANEARDGHGKERLLVFSDSRQDAAHQARFIIFASRYDRMRRNLVGLLNAHGPLSIQRAVELLGLTATNDRDNPHIGDGDPEFLPAETQQRIRAWEEAPLLDDLAVNAGYRATIVNLGLLEVRYDQLDRYVQERGAGLAESLGISQGALSHLCRCILDEMRRLGALSRELLRYHPSYPGCPAHIRAAEWERRVREPKGFAADDRGRAVGNIDADTVPSGIKLRNPWRRPGAGGRSPSIERIFTSLLDRFGGVQPDVNVLVDFLAFLQQGSFIVASELFGYRGHMRLLQVNSERVLLALSEPGGRMHCSVCGAVLAGSQRNMPCPRCHGWMVPLTEDEIAENRTVRRIRAESMIPLDAREHTAQVPNDERGLIEQWFKAPATESKVNLLACSPTLEMGIDVGGLEAVVLRNIPPRPDNYAQRGGRAGRRLRIGIVVGYARSTPHDQYFYDHPEEMISGEVPAPVLSLANRDVLLRHVSAIVFGASEPGLASRMADYISPRGEIQQAAVDALKDGLVEKIRYAMATAAEAFGSSILTTAQLDETALRSDLEQLPRRVQAVVDRTARQVAELRQALDAFAAELIGASAGNRAADLVARLLGLPTDRNRNRGETDERSAGYPLRRFAEFGILPGYEFPSEPASLRLLGDPHEEDPITVTRRFGIAQFQPGARVYARSKRWQVFGLDTSSPWNPQAPGPSWTYRVCRDCGLRYEASHPQCPRCRVDAPGRPVPAIEFAGFIAQRDENIVLDEEDRVPSPNRVKVYPQWNGDVVARWVIGPNWGLRLSQHEEIEWMNEGDTPDADDFDSGVPLLHREAKGYLLCASCGKILNVPPPAHDPGGRRRAQNRRRRDDPYGHSQSCPNAGTPPTPIAIATATTSEVLRLLVPVPGSDDDTGFKSWGLSLGYALQLGMRHTFMLDDGEIDFELEGPWSTGDPNLKLISLSFIDASIGGTGYLKRIADSFDIVAQRSIEQLAHPGCETACYRCLKSYQNQRFHELLRWPEAMDALQTLAAGRPSPRTLETGDVDDPTPWVEAYRAGVGSPLELQFLRLFEQHNFYPQRQVAVPTDRPISIADFAVPDARLAIYVDGAAFHVGANLRRDHYIRERLRSMGWHVEQLQAAELAQGASLVRRLVSAVDEYHTSRLG